MMADGRVYRRKMRYTGAMNELKDQPTGSRGHRRFLPWACFALVLALMVFFLAREKDLSAALLRVSMLSLAGIFLLQCLFNAVTGLMLRELSLFFGVRLNVTEWYGLPAVTTMGNYLTPASGGLVARAVYLKQRYGLSYPRFLSLLSSGYLVNFLVISAVGMLLVLGRHSQDARVFSLALFFLAVFTVILFLLHRPVPLPDGEGRVKRFLRDVMSGWPLMKSRTSLIGKLIALSLVNILLGGSSLWLAFNALGYPVPGADAILVSLLQAFSLLMSVTPGNLGVQEGIVSLSSGLLGYGLGAGLLAALLVRAVTVLFILSHGPLFSYLLSNELIASRRMDPIADEGGKSEQKQFP
jgi:uncharacterized membrane protein YbhN (UPF0104 family)